MQRAAGQCECMYVCVCVILLHAWGFLILRMRASAFVYLRVRTASVSMCVCSHTLCDCVRPICKAARTWGREVLPAYRWASISASLPLSPAQTPQPAQGQSFLKTPITFIAAFRLKSAQKKERKKEQHVNKKKQKRTVPKIKAKSLFP